MIISTVRTDEPMLKGDVVINKIKNIRAFFELHDIVDKELILKEIIGNDYGDKYAFFKGHPLDYKEIRWGSIVDRSKSFIFHYLIINFDNKTVSFREVNTEKNTTFIFKTNRDEIINRLLN